MKTPRDNTDRRPPARLLRRTFVVGKKLASGFSMKATSRLIASQITEHVDRQTDVLNDIVASEAKSAAKRLSFDILHGRVDVEPNSREYAAWKNRTGRGEHPLVSNGQYAESITAIEVRPGLHHVTVKPGVHRESGLSLARLSRILEEGTLDGIPARPHFAIAARAAKRRITDRLAQYHTATVKASAMYKNRKPRLRP